MLRVEGLPDFYVSVTAVMERSCFGMSLEQLVCCTEPVRAYSYPSSSSSRSSSSALPSALLEIPLSSPPSLAVPKELARLLNVLYGSENGNCLKERGLFSTSGEADEVFISGRPSTNTGSDFLACCGKVSAIRLSLDRGLSFPQACSVHSYVEVLLAFLSSLARPVIPTAVCPTASVN